MKETLMSEYVTWRAMRQFVTISGEKLAYVRVGTAGKPPLILVHGWLSHARFWQSTMEALQADFDCIAVDLYGFGFSDKHKRADYSIETQARRVLALSTMLGIKTFFLMGHSMGGGIVLSMASQQPERVLKVINVAGVVMGKLTPYVRRILVPPARLGYYIPQIWWISRIGMRHWRWYKYIYADRAGTYHKDVIPLGGEDLLMGVKPGCEVPTYHALNAIDQVELTAQLKTLRVPTLILFGANDNTVPISEGHHAHQHIPNSKMIVYEQCGHEPMLEYTARFVEDVKTFLQE
jgi:pimeloyl-ACP methyl ester carboxylesterase